jgi:hypothetical protein
LTHLSFLRHPKTEIRSAVAAGLRADVLQKPVRRGMAAGGRSVDRIGGRRETVSGSII